MASPDSSSVFWLHPRPIGWGVGQTEGLPLLGDPPASDNHIILIEDARLARSNGALWDLEVHLGSAVGIAGYGGV